MKSRFVISSILTAVVGVLAMAAALATGMSSLGAGYAVGAVGAAAMGALTEKPELFGRLLIFVGLAEGIAIYGVIISVLILDKIV
jgi:V/A-type H+-transporting ATPase subunit K